MENISQTYWRKCSSCKKEIPYLSTYQICSVSTCSNMDLVFCSVNCWDAHIATLHHRPNAGALEKKSPAKSEVQHAASVAAPKKIIVSPPATHKPIEKGSIQTDTLVVVSKVKNLIRDQSEFNTSQCFIDALTQKVVEECLKGIEHAKIAGRKTVMGRDL